MKNRLSDLNNHLFAQIERLGDEDLTPEKIETEVRRSQAIVDVAEQIIATSGMQLRGAALIAQHGDRFKRQLPMLEVGTTIEGN